MKREASQTIWRTVVVAGAMLGSPGCTKKQAATTPGASTPAAVEPQKGTGPSEAGEATVTQPTADPCAAVDPCGGERPRGTSDDEGGGVGRGFVLS